MPTTRMAALFVSVLTLAAPASGGEAANEPPRLGYVVSVSLSAPFGGGLISGGVCLAGAQGSEGIRVTAPGFGDPAWSPDGRRLAFSRGGIFVQNDGGRTSKVADLGYASVSRDPDWSPDGRRIVFDVFRFSRTAISSLIYSVRPDGSDLRNLAVPGALAFTPAWSPRGDAIAYSEQIIYSQQPQGPDLYLVDPDGANRRLLARDGSQPSWSPDGKAVVFVRYSPGSLSSDLVIVDADGRDERKLTEAAGFEENPAWSPDGKWIAFEQRAPESGLDATDIAVIRPDGSGLHLLRASSLGELQPAWRPEAPRRPGRQRPCVVRGSGRADVIRGSSLGDLILAGGGRDSIFGGGGGDLVDGGRGSDRIVGGAGADVLNGGFGRDRLLGGPGNDVLYSYDGEPDIVIGNSGLDEGKVDSFDRVSSVESVEAPVGS